MKRGVESRIGLAVLSMVMIMLIFGIVLILSGRTVTPVANAINIPYRTALPHDNVPCYLLKCRAWNEPTLLGYETIREGETYAMCVCAKITQGKAIYNEQEIKKIRVPSK